MPVEMVSVRHKKTGQKAFLPKAALSTFPDYQKTPSQEAREGVPDGTAFPAEITEPAVKATTKRS